MSEEEAFEDIDWAQIPKEERDMIRDMAKLLLGLRTAGRFGRVIARALFWIGWLILGLIALKNGTVPGFQWPQP